MMMFSGYFPHKIHTIIIDNGSEFTDRFILSLSDNKKMQKASGRRAFNKECKNMILSIG
jgi:hypothetical protein